VTVSSYCNRRCVSTRVDFICYLLEFFRGSFLHVLMESPHYCFIGERSRSGSVSSRLERLAERLGPFANYVAVVGSDVFDRSQELILGLFGAALSRSFLNEIRLCRWAIFGQLIFGAGASLALRLNKRVLAVCSCHRLYTYSRSRHIECCPSVFAISVRPWPVLP